MNDPIISMVNSEIIDTIPFNSKELLYLKIGILIVIIGITFFFGLMPLFCIQCRRNTKIIGYANAFSGGLFLGIALFHLLPEANENFEAYSLTEQGKVSILNGLPVPFFLTFISYSLILFFEKVAFDSHSLTEHTHHHNKEYEDDYEDEDEKKEALITESEENEEIEPQKKISVISLPIRKTNTAIKQVKSDMADEYFLSQDVSHSHNNEVFHDCFATKNHRKFSLDKKNENLAEADIDMDQDEYTIKHVVSSKGKFASYLHARNLMSSNDASQMDKSLYAASKIIERTMEPYGHVDVKQPLNTIQEHGPSDTVIPIHHKEQEKHRFTPTSVFTPYILLIALSLHGLFEGTALGVMTKFKGAIFLACAIIAHKWAESFALGISFFLSGTPKVTYIKMIILFSVFTPLGIFIGIMFAGTSFIIQAFLLSIASGTFIYISASEVIIEEFAVTKYRYQKYFWYLLGGSLVGVLKCIEQE